MTPLPFVIHPEALQDIEEFAQSYESLARGLGTQFIIEIDATLKRIAAFPLAHQISFDDCRRALLHRFPFAIGFRVHADAVRIDGVFPTQADPSRIVRLLMQRSGGPIKS